MQVDNKPTRAHALLRHILQAAQQLALGAAKPLGRHPGRLTADACGPSLHPRRHHARDQGLCARKDLRLA